MNTNYLFESRCVSRSFKPKQPFWQDLTLSVFSSSKREQCPKNACARNTQNTIPSHPLVCENCRHPHEAKSRKNGFAIHSCNSVWYFKTQELLTSEDKTDEQTLKASGEPSESNLKVALVNVMGSIRVILAACLSLWRQQGTNRVQIRCYLPAKWGWARRQQICSKLMHSNPLSSTVRSARRWDHPSSPLVAL